MARPELVQTVAKVLANVGFTGVALGTGVSLAYSALFTGAAGACHELDLHLHSVKPCCVHSCLSVVCRLVISILILGMPAAL